MNSEDRAASSSALMLDFLRAHRPHAASMRMLVGLGALFKRTPDCVRAAVNALVHAGRVERDEVGMCRLAAATSACSEHMDEWRLGEARRRPWQGDWFAVLLAPGAPPAVREASCNALERFGFRPMMAATYVRPNNLVLSRDRLVARLRTFGLEERVVALRMTDLDAASVQAVGGLWDLQQLRACYQSKLRALTQSAARVEELEFNEALVETFRVGGSAIRALATDPLLPEEIMPSGDYAVLRRAMLAYDLIARRLWDVWLTDMNPPQESQVENVSLTQRALA